MINLIEHERLLERIKENYNLPENVSNEVVIYNLIRKIAVIYTPCSINLLKVKLTEQIEILFKSIEKDYNVEEYLDDLIAYGDLLELSDVVLPSGADFKKNTIFLSQSRYVRFKENEVYLIGGSNENEFPKNTRFEDSLFYLGPARILKIDNENDLRELENFGFNELPKDIWLNLPKENLNQYYDIALNELNNGQENINIDNLEIFAHSNSNNYNKRKKSLDDETGLFICKKMQQFSSDLWGLIKVENGRIVKFINLPFTKNLSNNIRSCDEAWRLMATIDYKNNCPQKYKVITDNFNKLWIQFFSPVPKWIERKLILQGGEKRKGYLKSLYSISISENNLKKEKDFLKSHLGLLEREDGNN